MLLRGCSTFLRGLERGVLFARGMPADYMLKRQNTISWIDNCISQQWPARKVRIIAWKITYAARFCALRLLCAGINDSFSSLLLRLIAGSANWPSSPSMNAESGFVLLFKSLLETECLEKESGGECGGGTKDEGSGWKEGSRPGKYWL